MGYDPCEEIDDNNMCVRDVFAMQQFIMTRYDVLVETDECDCPWNFFVPPVISKHDMPLKELWDSLLPSF